MNRIVLSIAAVAALAFSAVACAAPEGPETDEPTGTTAQAQTSNGFFCGPSSCHCKEGADNPVDSCDGMMRVCDLIGPGMLCAPDGWCSCKITKTATIATAEPTPPKPPRIAPVATATTTTKLAP